MMDANQSFFNGALPLYVVLPNPQQQYVVYIKLSNELLEKLQKRGSTENMTICFGQNGNHVISLGSEQFGATAETVRGVIDCYRQIEDEEDGGTFTKVGAVKRKIFVTQRLSEADRKRVKTAIETHEKERKSHKSVLIDNTTGELISKDNKKRKVQSSLQKSSSLPVKRKRTTEPIIPRPQLGKDITLPQSSLPSSPKRSPLRTKLLRILAQEPLSLDQIQAKCGAKIPLAQTLQQVADLKDGVYHLKKELQGEVETNLLGIGANGLERRANALQNGLRKRKDEPAGMIVANRTKLSGTSQSSPAPPSVGKETKEKEEKASLISSRQPLPISNKVKREEEKAAVKENVPEKGRNTPKEVVKEKVTDQMTHESSPNKAKEEVPNGDTQAKEQMEEIFPQGSSATSDYVTRKAEWEKKYREYRELHKKLHSNAKFFEELRDKFNAASKTEKQETANQIKKYYTERISTVRLWKKRISELHNEIKEEKAAILALRQTS